MKSVKIYTKITNKNNQADQMVGKLLFIEKYVTGILSSKNT